MSRSSTASERGRIGWLVTTKATPEEIEAARAALVVAKANADIRKIPGLVDDAIARGASTEEAVAAAAKILVTYGDRAVSS